MHDDGHAVHRQPPRGHAPDAARTPRNYRYPLLLPGCTGCKACSQICPDFVFQVYKFETPQELG